MNNFNFGKKEIGHIIKNLSDAGIQIVECGFLMNKDYDENRTIFNDVKLISKFFPTNNNNKTMNDDITEKMERQYYGAAMLSIHCE